MKNKAFTLIELLVVVLIIGILAAIAVPQYQKAVKKSRLSQAFILLKAIDDAQKVYFLANGEYSTKFADLDISISEIVPNGNYDQIVQDKFTITQYIDNGKAHSSYLSFYGPELPTMEKYYNMKSILCWHRGDAKQKEFCASLSNNVYCGVNNCELL